MNAIMPISFRIGPLVLIHPIHYKFSCLTCESMVKADNDRLQMQIKILTFHSFINMNRLSSHNKYILKEGKYVLQSAADQQLFSHRARSDFNESVDSAKDCPVKDNELGRKQCGSARQPLPADMTASAILPRKLDYLPKHFASKKIGKDLLTGSVNHSPLKLDAQLHSSRLEQPLKLLRSPFD